MFAASPIHALEGDTPKYNLEFVRQKTKARLIKVRERLAREAQEKARMQQQMEVQEKQMKKRKEKQRIVLEQSEEARRQRCYSLYNKLGSPTKAKFQQMIETLPFEHHRVEVEDVNLLPWEKGDERINLADIFSLLFQ